MPYVAIPIPAREELSALAERRLAALADARPDLSPAVDLQRSLLAIVIEVAHTISGGRMPRLSLPPKYLAAKLSKGVPALAGEPIPLPAQLLKSTLIRLCEELAAGGAGAAAENIGATIAKGAIDAGSLLTASLSRDHAAISGAATHQGLAPDLLWLVAELAVAPIAHALQRSLFERTPSPELAAALGSWNFGYCGACGSWPALAEVVGGHRMLRCSFCSATWELTNYACVYCNESGDPFVTAAPDLERKDRRVEVCRACKRYLKTVDLAELSPFPLLAITDLETMDLDAAAMQHGFARPTVKEFKKKG